MKPEQEKSTSPEVYDFDRRIERAGTDSVKWHRYPSDVMPLWVADMDFRSPQPVIDILRRRVEHGVFGYGVEPPELRPVIRDRLHDKYGWSVSVDDILFLPGVIVGFNLVARTFAQHGEGILIQTPVYPPFFAIGPNNDRVIERAPLVQSVSRHEIDFDAFERAITPRARVFLLCNPHNPVGRVFTRNELERLAEICLRHGLVICSDEIHQDFVYEGHVHVPIASLSPEVAARTVTLISPTKSYNIAGFHISAAIVTNPELRNRMSAVGAGIVPGRPGILDFIAGLAAYQHGNDWLEQLVPYLQANRDFLMGYVRDNLPGISLSQPEGTYLAWLDCRKAAIPTYPYDFFLEEAHVAFNEGTDFGTEGEGFVRLNFGCPRGILVEALERMKGALERLRTGGAAVRR